MLGQQFMAGAVGISPEQADVIARPQLADEMAVDARDLRNARIICPAGDDFKAT